MRWFKKVKTKNLKRIHFVVSLNTLVFGLVALVSMVITLGLVGTSDYYTLELEKTVPEMPFVLTIQPVVFLMSTMALSISIKIREVVRDVYRERRNLWKERAGAGRINRGNES